ncbi:hypothetical protein AB832_01560 [Flavobacteriaceae bacterium (ex Bugula neritina AB1)]|nr:hypothetical protein AB832_01560 [Flavobacteriaceae bacterium (ex Bugula neritina AB1)]
MSLELENKLKKQKYFPNNQKNIPQTMKTLPYYFLILITLCCFISCSNENFEDIVADDIEDEVEEDEDTDIVADTPCDFDLSAITANSTITIDCLLDLEGKTVNLPANVNFDFDGGDIFNGTLTFSGGYIDGRLLNHKLGIEGDAVLKEPIFNFKPSRWDIREGDVAKADAMHNKETLQKTVDLIKKMTGTIFKVGKMDAFFDSDDIWLPAVFLPSNFHFSMADNTIMRVYPSTTKNFTTMLFRVYEEENITISGGQLVGSRELNMGPPPSSGTIITITTGINVVVDNVHISLSSVSGLTVNSSKFAQDPNYIPSSDVVIKNCTFDSNRRNNLSVTDAVNTIIDNCKIYRAGIDMPNSLGSSPIIGIDIEPDHLQKIDGVIIRNCFEEGGAGASIVASGGNDITIINNDLERPMAYNIASNVKILDNTIRKGGIDAGIKSDVGRQLNRGTVISGNTIMNFGIGIKAYNQDIKIFDNKIVNCGVGIMMNALKDSEIYNNTITSDLDTSFGINALDYVDNVTVRNNTVTLPGRSIFLDVVNANDDEQDYKFTFRDNDFNTGKFGMMRGTTGVDFIENSFDNGFRIDVAQKVLFHKNTITNDTPFTIHISNSEKTNNITITDNTIENTNTAGQGNGILVNSGTDVRGDSNILIRNNDIKVRGFNNGVNVKEFDGITIDNNRGQTEDRPFIFFRGNNGVITNNTTLAGPPENDIEGTNNTVNNN